MRVPAYFWISLSRCACGRWWASRVRPRVTVTSARRVSSISSVRGFGVVEAM